jgi:hypothetical protein
MIKTDNIEVFNFRGAIRGMRNPLNSWDKSDSKYSVFNFNDCEVDCAVGNNDLVLMNKLYKAGSEHRKFARQIFVSMDITAPLYWWKEFDTYKIGTTSNSCSTMHTIHKKKFEFDDFSHEHLNEHSMAVLEILIGELNIYREAYIKTKNKAKWWHMIQLLPTSYNQTRTITMSYENIFNIIKQRTNHKLDEWNTLVKVFKDLPYVREIMGE